MEWVSASSGDVGLRWVPVSELEMHAYMPFLDTFVLGFFLATVTLQCVTSIEKIAKINQY